MNRRLHLLPVFLFLVWNLAVASCPSAFETVGCNNITISSLVTPCTANPPNGAVNITVTPPDNYTYAWSNGAFSEDITDLPAGLYTVTVTLAGVCTATEEFIVWALNPGPLSVIGTVTSDTCAMGVGAIVLVPLAGNPPFNYNWSNGAHTKDLTGLTGNGTYFVTITDAIGGFQALDFFVGNYTGFFNQNINSYYSVNTFNNTTCTSPPNGGIDYTALTQVPFNWIWSNGVTTPDNLNLSAGNYTATVTLGNCAQSWNPNIAIFDTPNNPTVAIAPIDAICGGANGMINLTVTSGASPFTFAWTNASGSFSANTEDISNIPAGDYSVTVTGANGCTFTNGVSLSNINLGFNIGSVVEQNTSCTLANGSIMTNIMPNPPPAGLSYAYAWAGGQTTSGITGLVSGNYTVTVTLGSTCTANSTIFVGNGTQLPTLSVAVMDETCQGPGSVDLSVSGGTGPFGYQWSNGATTQDLASVMAGNYSVTVTAADGCTASITATVLNNNSGSDTTYVNGTTCDSMGVGVFEVILIGQGGCDSIVITTVSLLPSDTTTIFGNTCFANDSGVFVQNLTNQFGCDSLVTTTITYVGSDTTFLSGSSCDMGEVGVFEESLMNGFGCDSVIITTISFVNADTTALYGTTCDINQAGIIVQLLANSSGCDSVVITYTSYIAADTTALFETTCDINQAGIFEQSLTNIYGCDSIIITTVNYAAADTTTFASTTCDTTEAGVFEVVFTNSTGCDSVVITTISYVASDSTYLFGTSCNPASVGVFIQDLVGQNGCDSTIITTVAYSLSDTTLLSATTCDPTQVGSTELHLTTAEGCDSVVITTLVLAPPVNTALSATTCDPTQAGVFTQMLSTWQGCDSIATMTVTLLPSSNTDLTATTCDASQTGVFTEILTNWLGCDSIVTTTVTFSPTIHTNLNASTCDASQAGIFIQTLTSWQGCDSIVTTMVVLVPSSSSSVTATTCDPAQAGVFTETLTNWVGCDSVVTTTVSFAPPPMLTLSTSDYMGYGVSCANGSDGWAQVTASGGAAPLSFIWSNGVSSSLVEGLEAGTYTVTVIDGNGCSNAIGTVVLTEPDLFFIDISITDPSCNDLMGGEIIMAPSGGVPPYLFTMDGSVWQTSYSYEGLGEGLYQIHEQDANGCNFIITVSLEAPETIVLELVAEQPIIFEEQSTNLQAILNVPIGTLTEVTWTGLGNVACPDCLQQEVSPTETTVYTVTVKDIYGCSGTDSVIVTVVEDPEKYNIYIPSAFSPNKDGINDFLTIYAGPGVKMVKSFRIFDIWGDTVFLYFNFPPNRTEFSWDGKHKGELMDPAVFIWIAEVEFMDGEVKIITGSSALIK